MNSEKRKDDLMKQGRGLATLSVWLIIFALVLGVVLLDLSFVPSGELWKEMKSEIENSFAIEDPNERGKEHSDKEIWEILKNAMVEQEIVPFKSGFLCWAVLQTEYKKQSKQEIEPTEQAEWETQSGQAEWETRSEQAEQEITPAQQTAEAKRDVMINAQTALEIVDEYISDMGIYTDSIETIDCYLHDKRVFIMCIGAFNAEVDFLIDEEKNELESRLLDVFPDVNEAALKVYVFGSECTAAVFAPDVYSVVEGVDFPYIDEYGHFDLEELWGYGWSDVHNNDFIIGYADETGYVG